MRLKLPVLFHDLKSSDYFTKPICRALHGWCNPFCLKKVQAVGPLIKNFSLLSSCLLWKSNTYDTKFSCMKGTDPEVRWNTHAFFWKRLFFSKPSLWRFHCFQKGRGSQVLSDTEMVYPVIGEKSLVATWNKNLIQVC